MHPLFDMAIINIIKSDPYAIIIISRNSRQFDWNCQFRKRLIKLANNEKIDISNRLIFINQMKHKYYSYLLCSFDISLDPFPFGYYYCCCYYYYFIDNKEYLFSLLLLIIIIPLIFMYTYY